MKKQKWTTWLGLTAAAVLAVTLYIADHTQEIDSTSDASSLLEKAGNKKVECGFWSKCDLRAGTSVAATSPIPTSDVVAITSRAVIAGQEPAEKIMFQINAKGRIVLDEEARLNIEKLYALNEPGERAKKHRDLEQSLPPAASRELTALMARYDSYQEAQLQTYPPGQELSSAAEGLLQLDGLHELRVQHFGAEAAAGFYGAEEKMQRELLVQMSLDKDSGLTLGQKAEKAQSAL